MSKYKMLSESDSDFKTTILFIALINSLTKDIPNEEISAEKICELMKKHFEDKEIKEYISKNLAEISNEHLRDTAECLRKISEKQKETES